jgi:hypothetical protein
MVVCADAITFDQLDHRLRVRVSKRRLYTAHTFLLRVIASNIPQEKANHEMPAERFWSCPWRIRKLCWDRHLE